MAETSALAWRPRIFVVFNDFAPSSRLNWTDLIDISLSSLARLPHRKSAVYDRYRCEWKHRRGEPNVRIKTFNTDAHIKFPIKFVLRLTEFDKYLF